MGIKDWIEKAKKEAKVIEGDAVKDQLYSSEKEYKTEEDAALAFVEGSRRLFLVNDWSKLPGITSDFILYDSNGQKKSGKAEVDDYIKIILPGPSPENWVVVTRVDEAENMREFVVSPSKDPTEPNANKIEHFFIDEATSTFRIERHGRTLYAAEIGKNEGINNEGMEAGKRKLINTLIAEGGWAGFQKMQWKKLTDYLVGHVDLEDS